MNHKTKSFLIVLLVLAIMAVVGFFANEGITGGVVVNSVACHEHTNCDDGIEETEDICRNPGTVNSLCVNRPRN